VACVSHYCPSELLAEKNGHSRYNITGVDFSAQNEVVATYSGADVYLFDVDAPKDSSGLCSTFKQVYTGRRNVQTFLKEVTFFGDDSYITTGSDCGHLFIWEKHSANLVQILKADKNVVNGVSPNPVYPILAACGIDSSAKIIECGEQNTFATTYATKITERNAKDTNFEPSISISQLMEFLRSMRGDAIPDSSEEGEEDEEGEGNDSPLSREWMYKQEIDEADELRAQANSKFQLGQYQQALDLYEEALSHLSFDIHEDEPNTTEVKQKRENGKLLCYVNKAATHLKMKLLEEVIIDCNLALEIQGDNIKALYRRGVAFLDLKKYAEALADLQKAAELAPNDTTIRTLLDEVTEKIAKQEI